MTAIKGLHGGIGALVCVLIWTGCHTRSAQRPAEQEANPAPAPPASINEPFKEEKVDVAKWVERFESPDREIYAQRARIVQELRLLRHATVADIGAGTGVFTTLLAEAVGPRGKVYAVEIAPDFLLHIRQRAETAGLNNIEPILGSERSVSLPPNSIDLAFLCDVYHHLDHPQSTLASLRTALRPGAELVLIDFKRVEGESSDWVMEHVRAGQETFAREIRAAGFRLVEEKNFLKENYYLRFRKVGE